MIFSRFFRFRLIVRLAAALILAALFAGCQSVGYYSQAVAGQTGIWLKQRDIEALLADPGTDEQLKARLVLAQQARTFASERLLLPKNQSYTSYVDLERDYVVWNVVATERYSVDAYKSCFPVVGCLSYRGYYDRQDAIDYGKKLKQQGFDVYIGGVSAYSTLGWFSDPLLSTMFSGSDAEIAALIFHELAHQRVYIRDDTGFNESFATAVAQLGLEQWFAERNLEEPIQAYMLEQNRREAVIQLVLSARERMREAYRNNADAGEEKLAAVKAEQFEKLRADYAALRASGGGTPGFDRFFTSPLNNASLALFGEYHGWVDAFKNLFESNGRQWDAFYQSVDELARAPRVEREQKLASLLQAPAT